MPKLPRADGKKHIAAFRRAGWVENHVEGSHRILKLFVFIDPEKKQGAEGICSLSFPHGSKTKE